MNDTGDWLVFGSSGMLGSDLIKALTSNSMQFRAPLRDQFSLGMGQEELLKLVGKAEVVANCIAYTKVDMAESELKEAFEVNHVWPEKLAQACKASGSHLIHFSTDYVFSGDKETPYLPTDSTNPISIYGKSKEAGEKAVMNSGAQYSIFRTAWLYGENGSCFPRTISQRLEKGLELSIVSDQFGSPTWTRDLTELVIRHVELSHLPQIVHATSSGICSWYEFALEIAESLGYPRASIKPIASSEYKTAAMRPKYSALHCEPGPAGTIGHWRERWREASELFR